MAQYRLRFNPDLLPSFFAVAETGGISLAAKALAISQPSVTAHVRQLEEELDVALFHRSARGAELTPEGRKFLDQAKKAYEILNDASFSLVASGLARGTLDIAASTTVADYILPPLLAQFRKRYPQVKVSLTVRNTEGVLQLVRDGASPIGLVEGLARAASLRLEPFREDELVLVIPPAWEDLIRSSSDILKFPLLLRERGSGTRDVAERALRKQGLGLDKFSQKMEIGSSAAIKSAVAAGLGLSFLSKWSVQNEVALGKITLRRFTDLKMARTLNWVFPAGAIPQPASAFYQFAQLDG